MVKRFSNKYVRTADAVQFLMEKTRKLANCMAHSVSTELSICRDSCYIIVGAAKPMHAIKSGTID